MITENLLKISKENSKVIDTLNKAREKEREEIHDKIREVENKYYKKEQEIRELKSKEERVLRNKNEKLQEEYTKKVEELHNPIGELKKIFSLFEVIKEYKNYGVPTPEVYYHDYIRNEKGYLEGDKQKFFYNPVMVLVEDDFKKILLYITKNDKPKNKYSLIAVGNSIFNKGNLSLPYTYRIKAHIDNANIREEIKEYPTEKECKEYAIKNKEKILRDFLVNHEKVEKEYLEVKPLYELKEWKMAFLEDKKEYYKSSVSNGTETEEYKEVLKEIEKLK